MTDDAGVLTPPLVQQDGRLGWQPRKDPASRGWQVAEPLERLRAARVPGPRYNRFWKPGPTLDQLREGQCVSEAMHGTRNGVPLSWKPPVIDFEERRAFYHRCQHADPWTGCAWGQRCTIAPSSQTYGGTSTLAGAKEGRRLGWWRSFRWVGAGSGTLEDDIIGTLSMLGTINLGTVWRESMYETRPSGLIDISGADVGGHCYRAVEWIPRLRLAREWKGTKPAVAIHNSWGPGFGIRRRTVTGVGFLLLEDLMTLMEDDGEGVVAIP